MNRFKGLDLVDRMPEELWMEICNTVQEVVTKTIPKKKKYKKAKWLSEKALQSITTNKASGGDGISAELFRILKYDVVKLLTPYADKLGKLSSGHRTGNDHFSL